MGLAQNMRLIEAAMGSPYYTALLQEGIIPPAHDCQRLVVALLASQRAKDAHAGYFATEDQEHELWAARSEVVAACRVVGVDPAKLGEL